MSDVNNQESTITKVINIDLENKITELINKKKAALLMAA